MSLLHWMLDFLRRLTNPEALNLMAGQMDGWLYAILFIIVFCETGLVVLPFLPGDSLVFAIGALGALPGTPIKLWLMGILLTAAAVLGDAVNYSIGSRLGPAVFHSENGRWLNKKHLLAAHAFYEKYGGKTIILARFIPIVRTFAPFIAGIGKMTYAHFAIFNITGAILWVGIIMTAGRLFGGIPWVKTHFESVLVAIIVISLLPAVLGYLRSRVKGEA
jgi:membrane-associated protein